MKELLFLDDMITPKVITFIYWLALIAIVLGSLFTIFQGEIIGGLLTLVGGAIAARVWCELIIVIFRINENLKKIAERNSGNPG
ncbi:MAG: DUF4282 domain-containing protein [Gammaproteobacteria bacterium]|nr:DUF4282 domain-containing protein [Gammaproteobacteria bacterium]